MHVCLGTTPAHAARAARVSQRIFSPSLLVLQAVEGVEVVWQSMPSPKGIFMFFHGCRHSATDYFPKSDSCPACLGEASYPPEGFSRRGRSLHIIWSIV